MLDGYPVFDVHHHVGDASAVLGTAVALVDSSAPAPADAAAHEVKVRLDVMDAGGVDWAAVIPGHGYHRPLGLADTQRINDHIAAYRAGNPTRFPVAVGVIEPAYGPHSLPEIDRIVDELHLDGVSFHVRFQGVSLDNQWIRTYIGRIIERGLVPIIHAVPETSENPLWKVAAIARAFPESPMLVLDAFESHESTKECFHTAEIAPNLLFDTSLASGFELIEQFARALGPERVVFGTDLYSWPLGRRISRLLPDICHSELDDAAKRAILAGNARRLFSLDPRPPPAPFSGGTS
jgi:predicted TIM-barrel fold metal-dependent hydrolase